MERTLRFTALLVVLAAWMLIPGLSTTASAEQPDPANQHKSADHDFVVDELFTLDGDLISARAFTRDGTEIAVPSTYSHFTPKNAERGRSVDGAITPNGSGGGGSPGPTGCRAVTVNNEVESTLGFTLMWWHSQTYWCWNSYMATVSDVATTEWASDIDVLWPYLGLSYDYEGYYEYFPGFTASGCLNYKQAHFQSCVTWVCQNEYPYNQLWSYYTGAYEWSTTD